jgi:hypothetical protein
MLNRYKWVARRSQAGYLYEIVEDLMAVTNSFLQTIVYIYPNAKFAKEGEALGGASGFLTGVLEDEREYLYAITNAHVIEGMRNVGLDSCVLRFNTLDGKIDTIEAPLAHWTTHPSGDDLAAFPLRPSVHWRYNFLTRDSFLKPNLVHGQILTDEPPTETVDVDEGPPKKWLEVTKVGIGDEVIMIGRYSKHSGTLQNLPVARFGHVSMLPFEPVYQEDRDFYQDSFLVEAHSVNGFSGSPVFLQKPITLREQGYSDGDPNRSYSSKSYKEKTFLLGVDWGHFDFKGELIDPRSRKVKVPSGMMCVVPAWKLDELLQSEDLRMQRKELDKEIKKKEKDGATMDSELTKEEFERVLDAGDKQQREDGKEAFEELLKKASKPR